MSVWVPDWPVVALTLESRSQQRDCRAPTGPQRPPNPALTPVAVIGGRGVRAASAPARAAGVGVGMRSRVARSLCPGLVVLSPQPEREARAFETVMEALSTLLADPLVARPGLALSAARGPSRWAGGEEELAAALVEVVAQGPGVECQVGIADSLLGAVLAARCGVIVPSGATPGFLAPWELDAALTCLPTQRLRTQGAEVIQTLNRLGLRTLGDLAALPGRDVSARFGPVGHCLHRLASGEGHEVPRSARPATDLAVESALDPPVERADTAAFIARFLAESLAAKLTAAGLGVGRLLVEARCADGAEIARSWMLDAAPTPEEITDRVRWQLEGWLSGCSGRPSAGPLTHLRLSALEPVPAGGAPAGLWDVPGRRGQARSTRAAERVESLLGVGRVQVPLLVPGRDPRSRVRLLPWGTQDANENRGEGKAPWSGGVPAPSPSVVLADPVPAMLWDASGHELTVRADGHLEGTPARLRIGGAQERPAAAAERARSRGTVAAGEDPPPLTAEQVPSAASTVGPGAPERPWEGECGIVSWAGPWPVDEGWWRPGGASRRAYLQVVPDQGPPLLLVRSGRWWLDAVYS